MCSILKAFQKALLGPFGCPQASSVHGVGHHPLGLPQLARHGVEGLGTLLYQTICWEPGKDLTSYIPIIFLVYSWGSLFGVLILVTLDWVAVQDLKLS